MSWFLLSSNFLVSLSPYSHFKNKWWRPQVIIAISEKKDKTGYSYSWIFFSIYLCTTYFISLVTSYKMRQKCLPRKIRRSTKLRCVQHSPELFARSTNVSVLDSLIFPAKSTCGKGKLVFARFPVPIKVMPVKMIIVFIQNLNCRDINKWMGFCTGTVFTEKNMAHLLVTNSLFG